MTSSDTFALAALLPRYGKIKTLVCIVGKFHTKVISEHYVNNVECFSDYLGCNVS